jgi:hypothetical protein
MVCRVPEWCESVEWTPELRARLAAPEESGTDEQDLAWAIRYVRLSLRLDYKLLGRRAGVRPITLCLCERRRADLPISALKRIRGLAEGFGIEEILAVLDAGIEARCTRKERRSRRPRWDKCSLADTWDPQVREVDTLGDAMRLVRTRLGDSTYQFAKRVGSNPTSVWMCEHGLRGARHLVAKRLWKLAARHGMRDLTDLLWEEQDRILKRQVQGGWR